LIATRVFAMSDIIAIAAFPVTLFMRRYTSVRPGEAG
jgi:hypothetical protein